MFNWLKNKNNKSTTQEDDGITIIDVAEYFINHEDVELWLVENNDIYKGSRIADKDKIMNLCYFALVWNKTIFNELLFDEEFEATVSGVRSEKLSRYLKKKSFSDKVYYKNCKKEIF